MRRFCLFLLFIIFLGERSFAFYITFSLMFCDSEDADMRCEQYIDELKSCDIYMIKSKSFNPIDIRGDKFILKNIAASEDASGCSIGDIVAVALESEDKNAVLLYPTIPLSAPVNLGGVSIEDELRANYNNDTLDIRPLIKIVRGENLSEYANADTAVVYSLDFKKPFLDNYPHCIGIYLRKYAHQSLLLKIAMTDEGWINREQYIKILLESLRYGSELMPSYVEWEERPVNKRKSDFNYPSKSPIAVSGYIQ